MQLPRQGKKRPTELALCRQALVTMRDIQSTTPHTKLPNSNDVTAGQYATQKVFGARNKSLRILKSQSSTN